MVQNEYFTGLLGLKFYFGVGKPKGIPSTLAESARFKKTVKERAKEWANQKRPTQPPKATYTTADYDNVIALLDNPLDANPDLMKIPPELQVDVVAKYLDIRSWLEANQPVIKFTGGLIARELPPAEIDQIRFMWSVNMIDDVSRIFDLLAAGCLTPVEAQVMQEIYPEVALAVVVEYIKAAIDYLYDNQFSALSGWKLAGLSALIGVPITSFEDVMSWQMNYDQQGPGRPPGSKAPNLAENNVSDMQALSAPV